MKKIIGYIQEFSRETNKWVLGIVTILTVVLIFLNYHYLLDDRISSYGSFYVSFFSRFLIFFVAFTIPHLLYCIIKKENRFRHPAFSILLLICPAIFSLKIALDLPVHISNDYAVNNYWNHIIYWPLLLCICGSIVFLYWRIMDRDQPLYGFTSKGLVWTPYWAMLLIMLPLIGLAATQPDFQAAYPKINAIMRNSGMELTWWHKLLFELSYGSDFISIEFFFRGFLILAFVKIAGKDAIVPMACFYCTIHFGKPLGECISSYFGGLLLGIVVANTRSIYGGLMVHLGIAWLMELAGYLSANWQS